MSNAALDPSTVSVVTRPAPCVSVVMIFLDAAPYLDESVRSVLGQTFGDLELVLVDDGSTDDSAVAARRWAERDHRVRLLHHAGRRNRGTAASRALGCRSARGRWIAFLDGDDIWLPDHLATQMALLERHPAARIVVAPARIWHSWREDGRPDHVRELPYPADTLMPVGSLLESVTFSGAAPIPTCGLLFDRDLLPEDGPAETAFRGLFEDQTFIARLTMRGPAVAAGAATALYRQRPGSLVQRAPGYGGRDPVTLRYLDWVTHFLAQHGQLTHEREQRLASYRAAFTPKWRFWAWYAPRWLLHQGLPRPLRVRLGRLR